MLKLQWLQINKFRAVKPGTRLVFNPSFNVLLGQNGTGKTTLLNLIGAVVSFDFTAFQDEEFELEYALADDSGRMTTRVHNRRAAREVSAELALIDSTGLRFDGGLDAPMLSVDVEVLMHGASQPLSIRVDGKRAMVEVRHPASGQVSEQSIAPTEVRFWHFLVPALIAANEFHDPDLIDPLPMLFSSLLGQEGLVRFDESLGYFEKLGEERLFLARLKKEARVIGVSGEAPKELLTALQVVATDRWGAERYAFSPEQVPLLGKVASLLGFQSAEAIFELQESMSREGRDTFVLGGLGFMFVRSGGNKIAGRYLSYGQKRMLAFMYYQATVRDIVIADELVNGLHHSWIRACIEVLGERQVFLTSQNPLLLDYLTFDSPDQVRSTFVLCRWHQGEGGGQMLWEDMSRETAEDFFASYKVGFQQVGELLQSKGLW